MLKKDPFLLFSGTSHPELSEEVAKGLGMQLGEVDFKAFPDREIGIEIQTNVRGRDVFALQTIARRPNHYLMELLILADALKRASARSVGFILPYYGYCRQDRRDKGRQPITARLVADLLLAAGFSRGIVMDLHSEQIQGFFDHPVDHLTARPALVDAIKKSGPRDFVVVAPDLGSIKIARAFASDLSADFAVFDKRRLDAKHVETGTLIGDVKGKNVLLVDDMVTTGETLKKAARHCKKAGAGQIFAVATHGLFVDPAFEESAIEKMFVTNTIPLPDNLAFKGIEVVSVAPLFSQALESILTSGSLSSFNK